MSTADAYFDRHGYDVDRGDGVDSHGNLTDGDAMRRIESLRATCRFEIGRLLLDLSKEGREIVQEYLDGEDDAARDACLQWWLEGCENHENGEDA